MATGVAYAVRYNIYKSNFYSLHRYERRESFIIGKMIEAARLYDEETAQAMEKAFKYATVFNEAMDKVQSNVAIERCFLFSEKNYRPIYEKFLGWDARSAIAATVFTCAVAAGYPQYAIQLGVHTPGDSDSIASMTGALMGALYGYEILTQPTNFPFACNWHKDVAKLEKSEQLIRLSHAVSPILTKQ